MKINYQNIAIAILCVLQFTNTIAQEKSDRLEIGDKMQALPVLNITNSIKNTLHPSDYTGKFMIIDFWATWCGPCISALPKMAKLQSKFHDKLEVLLVSSEPKKTVDDFFSSYKQLNGKNLALYSVYGDRILQSHFPHITIPHYAWIDDKGIVKAISTASDVTEENIGKFLANEKFTFYTKADRERLNENEIFFNEKHSPTLLSDSGYYGPKKIKYKSILTRSLKNTRSLGGNSTGRILGDGHVSDLFRQAYMYFFSNELTPVFENQSIFEVKNPEVFNPPVGATKMEILLWLDSNRYTYDLVLPDYYQGGKIIKGALDSLRKYQCEIMKRNLEDYFKVKSAIELRNVECLVLKSIDSTKHISGENYGRSGFLPARSGLVISNGTVENMIFNLKLPLQRYSPLIDETGYKGKINIRINTLMTDITAVNSELTKFGFQISKERRTIPILVVRNR